MRNQKITDKERLNQILNAIRTIEGYTNKLSRADFLRDRKSIDATLFQFAVIGEAIVHEDNDILKKYDYPWYKVRALRNFILHEYHSVNDRVIWDTVINDLPSLEKIIRIIVEKEFTG